MIRRSIRAMLAGGAALMLPGCVPTEMSGSKGNAEASIYYASQAEADAALAAFGRDNLECQLWTNWQKMCSRVGANGQVACALDSKFKVEPSEPFCSARSMLIASNAASTSLNNRSVLDNTGFPSRMRSANRYCQSRQARNVDGNEVDRGCGAEGYSDRRPFARPYWLIPESRHRLLIVEEVGLKRIGNEYANIHQRIKIWCRRPIEFDISQEKWIEDTEWTGDAPSLMRVRRLPMHERFRAEPVNGTYCELN